MIDSMKRVRTDDPRRRMSSICLGFYKPLEEMVGHINHTFPGVSVVNQSYRDALSAVRTRDVDLLDRLGPGATQQLLEACIGEDADTFFSAPSSDGTLPNPLVEFLGGREIYDRLDDEEKSQYWGSLLQTVVRQARVSYTIRPKLSTFDRLVGRLSSVTGQSRAGGEGGVHGSGAAGMRKLIGDGSIVSDVMELVDGQNGVEDLIGMMKTIASGIDARPETIDKGTSEQSSPGTRQGDPPVEEHTGAGVGLPPSLRSGPLRGVTGTSAGAILRKSRRKNRRAQTLSKRTAGGGSGLGAIVSMLDDIPREDINSLQQDLRGMKESGELASMMKQVCDALPAEMPTNREGWKETVTKMIGDATGGGGGADNAGIDPGELAEVVASGDLSKLLSVATTGGAPDGTMKGSLAALVSSIGVRT